MPGVELSCVSAKAGSPRSKSVKAMKKVRVHFMEKPHVAGAFQADGNNSSSWHSSLAKEQRGRQCSGIPQP
jgi:uncharacterized membrane protein